MTAGLFDRAKSGRFAATMSIALLAMFAMLFSAFAADLPALTGRVVDNANIIDTATEAALTQKLADFEIKGSDQIVVATINSLDGEEIESYATRLFNAWKLGSSAKPARTMACFCWWPRTTARCASKSAMGWKAR